MSDEKCTPKQTPVCDEKVLKEATEQGQCEDIDICLPFGGRLYTNGGCLAYEPGTAPTDGTYGKVKVQNGCIVGVEDADAEQYQASPCAPVPVPCDCDGSGGITLSPQNGNLSTLDSQGRLLTLLHTEAGPGIELSGNGTQQNPLVISTTGEGGGDGAVSGIWGDSIIIPNRHTGNVTLTHKNTGHGTISAHGFMIDAYGHITGYEEESASGVTAVLGSDTIKAETDNNTGVVTVSLLPLINPVPETTLHGGYNVSIDQYGRVTGLEQAILIRNAGTFTLGDYDVTVNTYGSITAIAPSSGGGGEDDPSTTGLSAAGTMFQYIWDSEYYISVEFTLAKQSNVRVLYYSQVNDAPGGLDIDIDDTIDLNQTMPYFSGLAYYSRTQVSAGTHTLHLRPRNVSGGGDTYGGTFDIQAFTLGIVDDGNNG